MFLTSTRSAKVEAARDAIDAIGAIDSRFRDAEIRTVDLGGAAPPMPMTEPAIIAAAERRVRALMEREPPATGADVLVMGLEGGLDPLPTVEGPPRWMLKSWACVTDGARWGYGAGGAVLIPDSVAAQVAAGEELGDVIDRMAGEGTRGTCGAWGVMTQNLIGRRDAFRTAVVAACAPLFNPRVFASKRPWSR